MEVDRLGQFATIVLLTAIGCSDSKPKEQPEVASASKPKEQPEVSSAKQAVKEQLKDSESAQFKDLYYVSSTRGLCGKVNARNSYGGYSGFSAFVVGNGAAYFEPAPDMKASQIGFKGMQEKYCPGYIGVANIEDKK